MDAEPVTVRLAPELLSDLDRWIASAPSGDTSRPEAIRRLLAEALSMPANALPLLRLDDVEAAPGGRVLYRPIAGAGVFQLEPADARRLAAALTAAADQAER